MRRAVVTLAGLGLAMAAAGGEGPANEWVEIGAGRKPPVRFASARYMPVTDEFMIWGIHGKHRYEGKTYEIQTLSLSDATPRWKESFPFGKEKTWAGG